MASVISKEFTGSLPVGNGTVVFYKSVNTPDFLPTSWYINLDLSAVDGYNTLYWKIVDDEVVLMTPEEQVLVNNYLEQSQPQEDLFLLNYVESSSLSSTTSTNAQKKVELIVEDLVEGQTYEIYWYCEIGASRRNEVFMNITVNDVEVARSEKSIYVFNSDAIIYESVSGFCVSTNLSGLNNIKLNYGDLNYGGFAVYIRNAKLGIKKV